MSQNYDEIIEPRETDEERAARESRLRAAEIAREFAEIDPGTHTPACCDSFRERHRRGQKQACWAGSQGDRAP